MPKRTYKAAALIPGVVVADKQATLDRRQGVALGIYWAEGKFREEDTILTRRPA